MEKKIAHLFPNKQMKDSKRFVNKMQFLVVGLIFSPVSDCKHFKAKFPEKKKIMIFIVQFLYEQQEVMRLTQKYI